MAKAASEHLQAAGVNLSVRHCCTLVKDAVLTGTVPSPQKPGGTFVSTAIEERIVKLIKGYRSRKLPVFGDDVMGWCTELIRGTVYEKNFPPDGKATEGWYRKFLQRTGMTTGTERPLEITRGEWLTEENLQRYYEVAEGVLLKAGVAVPNPDYDAAVPFSQPILITRPERIVSFDESRLELDCTATSKARSDHIVRAGKDDRGESLATKSSSTTSVVCGRTGTGKALPPYIVFSSGKTMHSDWCQPYTSQLQDADGNQLTWRYDSNEKGSVNEAKASDYIRTVIHPVLHNPKPRAEDPGNQGVVFCDGVGTHLGITVLETAIELGLEIVLRVPHLSFRLQGEDTHNFGPMKVSVNPPPPHTPHTHTLPITVAGITTTTTTICLWCRRSGGTRREGCWCNSRMREEEERMQREQADGRQRAAKKKRAGVTFMHLAPMLKPAWEHGFTEERNMKGWRNEGIIPFTRNELWRPQEEIAAAKAARLPPSRSINYQQSTGDQQQQQRQQTTSEAAAAAGGPSAGRSSMGSCGEAGEQAVRGSARGSEQIKCPPAIAGALAKAKLLAEPASLASLSKEEILKAYMEQHEVVNHFVVGIEVEQEDSGAYDDEAVPDGQEDNRGGRITAKNYWGLEGSVTGEEALILARRKEEERRQKANAAAAKVKEREDKKRSQMATAPVRAAEVLQLIKERGEPGLQNLPVKDLQALLVHSNPTAPAPKGNKADLLQKVRSLAEVAAAVRAAAAARPGANHPGAAAPAAVPASAAAPAEPQIPTTTAESLSASPAIPSNPVD